MRVSIVTASIGELSNIKLLGRALADDECIVTIIDEGDEAVRRRNRQILKDTTHKYYGPRERETWFKEHFGQRYKRYLSVIPSRCHAETSFGFLAAYEDAPDFVIELDDDVFPVEGHQLRDHYRNLTMENGVSVSSRSKWYNTLENLELSTSLTTFPRGHPYTSETREEAYTWSDEGGDCVLNMGLWTGQADLDAATILYNRGLDGRCKIEGNGLRRGKVIVNSGTYFALCSMNCSFLPEIVPAFYQLYMNAMGVDRFDDIWSGIFIKKIADHLDRRISLGRPLIYHDKKPRSTFKNLRSELEGMAINEVLWRVVDSAELEGKDYAESYEELADVLAGNLNLLGEKAHRDFISIQVAKMRLWLAILDKIE